jgi:hypothetical protein
VTDPRLRRYGLEHSHFVSGTAGGHFRRDLEPEEVEYWGHFQLAEKIFEIS